MPVKEKGYHGWDGTLKSSGFQWLPILRYGIRQVMAKRRAKLLFFFSAFPFLFFLVAVYVSSKPELQFMTEITRVIGDNASLFNLFFTRSGLMFVMILMSIYVGSDLISADLKFNSIGLYLSRPLRRSDYLIGKLAIIMSFLLMFSLVPALLLVLAKTLFSGAWTFSAGTFLAILIQPIAVSFLLASLILLFSSFSANTRFVIVSYVGAYFVTNMVAAILSRAVFKNSAFGLISLERNINQFSAWLFGQPTPMQIPSWLSPIVILALILLALTWTQFRINRVEA